MILPVWLMGADGGGTDGAPLLPEPAVTPEWMCAESQVTSEVMNVQKVASVEESDNVASPLRAASAKDWLPISMTLRTASN